MKAIKRKRCRECSELFTPFRSTQVVCSPICAVSYSKKKALDNKKKVDGWIKQDKDQKKLQSYLNYTKTVVHKMVRLRDKNLPCISCGCLWNDKFQAGHYHKAELFTSLKFDFYNINGQCQKCNLHLEGNLDQYKLRLPSRIGIDNFDKLNKRAELDRKFIKKWTRTELQEIQARAKIIIKKIKNI